MCININNTVINNNCRRFQDFTVPFKIVHGHTKEFLRNLQTIRARALKEVRQLRLDRQLTSRRPRGHYL